MNLICAGVFRVIRNALMVACSLLSAQALYSANIYSQPYTFTTLAGNAGYGSADGVGSTARFYSPTGVAVDGAGNLYVADTSNHTIRKITPTGVVSTLAGLVGTSGSADGAGANARFNNPNGVAVDSAGNVFVADTYNHTIRKITPGGVVSTLGGLAGSKGSADGAGGNARFYLPSGVVVDNAGTLYVADSFNGTIRKVTPDGVVSTLAGRAGSWGRADGAGTNAQFSGPSGVAVDSTGTLYVADTYTYTIRKVTPEGVVSTLAGRWYGPGSTDGTGSTARFNDPSGVAVDNAGNVYVADSSNHTLRKITPAGEVSTLAGRAGFPDSADGAGSNARFFNPSGVAVDSAGTLYVADTSNHTLRKVTPGPVVSTLAGRATLGSTDGTGTNARFNYPSGVAVDSAGTLYVADYNNHTLRKVTPDGVVSTLAGLAGSPGSSDGAGTNARFNNPHGVAVDGAGNVYVADYNNHTLRKVTPVGEVSTLAGLARSPGRSDGAGSNARFYYPRSVAVDSAGKVYVADSGNHTIREVTPAGVVSTLAGSAGVYGSADGAGTNAQFCNPSGVAVDSAGNVYVADYGNHAIREVTPAGVVSTLAGLAGSYGSADGAGTNARFYYPSGVAMDSASNVYVADYYNHTIRKVMPEEVVSTLAGLAGSHDQTDGTGANARFYNPSSVAVDSAGTLYMADTYNNTIRLGRAAPAPPALNLSPAGGQLILSWPLEGSNFLVEASRTLFPAPVWLPLTNAVGTSGNCCILTNGLDTGARFFRLRLP